MLRLLFLTVLACGISAAEWKAGLARVDITPAGPVWMSGYAARTKPSEGVLQRLGAKALAIDDGRRGRVVIVTADVIGFNRPTADAIAAAAQKRWGLERSQLLLNASHTHSGPVVRPNLATMYDLKPEQWKALDDYHAEFVDKVVNVIGAALGKMEPAQFSYHEGQAGFASNRRKITGPGKVANALNEGGPVDRSVPVLQVRDAQGKLTAVLFGYACHNTTLTGEFLQISGDYAGFAQAAFEAAHPGTTALFFIGTAGDQNPYPRSKLELAQQHGKALAAAVDAALSSPGQPVQGRLRTAFQYTDLEFAPRTREEFEAELKDKSVYKQRRAQEMLKAFDSGRPVRRVPYPIQAISFGKGVAMLALGGEVVVDYNLAAKKLYPKQKLMIAGYSNDVMCYIPSKRVLKEGGYEADDSMIYYGQPGPFAEDVEAGGTKFICGVGTAPENLEVSRPIATTTPDETMARVVEFFRGRKLKSLGLASFGPVDTARGVIARNTPKVAWRGCRLQDRLEKALKIKVTTDTDVNGAALAERRWGAARGVDPFLYLTVGTGIGMGGFVNGGLLHGMLHPEAGHLLLPRSPGDLFEGVCPIHGHCLEGLACGPAFAARLAAGQSEQQAISFTIETLARGVLNLSYAFSPQLVILGGGVMKRPGLLAAVRAEMAVRNNRYVKLPRLVRPKLGDRAGVLGALALGGA